MLRNEYGLTPKQETFAKAIAETGSLSAAYRQAFDAKAMKPETIHSRAYELSNHSEVRARVKALLSEKQTKEQWDRERAQSFARERLIEEATTAKDAKDRLRALELFGHLAEFDLFASKKVERTVVRQEPTKDAQERLRKAIERALAWNKSNSPLEVQN